MVLKNKLLLIGLSLLVLVTTIFCGATLPTEKNIVGTWVETKASCDHQEEACATIEFFPDGTYETTNFPLGLIFDDLTSPRVDGTGTWEYVEVDDFPFEIFETRLIIINTDRTRSINNYTIKTNFRNWEEFVIRDFIFTKVEVEQGN